MTEQGDSAKKQQDYCLLDTNIAEIESYIDKMLKTRENHPDKHLTSQFKVNGPFKRLLKKAISKLFKWYIDPLSLQQIDFNNAATPAIGKSTELLNNLLSTTKLLDAQLQVKQFQYEELSIQFQKQQEHYDELILLINQKHNHYDEQVLFISQKYNHYDELIQHNENKNQIVSNEINSISERLNKLDELQILENSKSYCMNSYSQAGEDNILDYVVRVLGISYNEVTYIDLGANHPQNLSNTYFFYSQGAKGVIVEANPNLIPELKFYRNRDIILNNCVDVVTGNELDFYIMNVDGLSTTSYESTISMCEKNPELEIIDKKSIKTISFNDIVETYLDKAPTILSIDLEGKDIEILISIDFTKYRPLMIVIEMIDYDVKLAYNTKNTKIKAFIETKGYEEYAYTGINSIFIDRKYLNDLT